MNIMLRRILMLFVDGLGFGDSAPAFNPIQPDVCPVLYELLREHAKPISAQMGVPGLPRSATGQTALLTGMNAASAVGRHVEGFPGSALRKIIKEHNIYSMLSRKGLNSTFANAYFTTDMAEVESRRFLSVTTVAALAAFGCVRDLNSMMSNQAVYHDLTRRTLLEKGYDGPLIQPEQAADHLIDIAAAHNFTLFEYFLTDRVGHLADRSRACSVLRELDAFLGRIIDQANSRGLTLLLTSDHGNIEDLRTRAHTANPVPLILAGAGSDVCLDGVESIEQVSGLIQSLLEV